MKKNYRLIKEYPGSPKLGTISEYTPNFLSQFPEFWEEVVDKDYEILSLVASEKHPQHKKGSKFLHNKDYKFKNMHPTEFWDIYSVKRISDNKIFTIGDMFENLIIDKMVMSVGGNILTTYKSNCIDMVDDKVIEKDYEILLVITNNNQHIEKVYNQDATFEPYWKIYSVKRLSDSQVFTIGDMVNSNSTISKDYPIAEFKIDNSENTILTSCYSTKNLSGTYNIRLKHLTKVKTRQKLFTTEDGVDIFEGDNLHSVDKNLLLSEDDGRYTSSSFKPNKNYKYFSTRKAAEEYILLNKPCLSYGDIQEYLKVKDCNKVLDLVQSKIQQSV